MASQAQVASEAITKPSSSGEAGKQSPAGSEYFTGDFASQKIPSLPVCMLGRNYPLDQEAMCAAPVVGPHSAAGLVQPGGTHLPLTCL